MSTYKVRILKNGAITLPAAIRRELDLAPGAIIACENRLEGMLLTFPSDTKPAARKSK